MLLPSPNPGRVVRYSYLWYDEKRQGFEDGKKPRPAVVLRAIIEDTLIRVYVAPITHTAPTGLEGIEIPPDVAKSLGLDWQKSWVICADVNEFVWAGPDLRPIKGKKPDTCEYGQFPPALFRKVRDRVMFLSKNSMMRVVKRTA